MGANRSSPTASSSTETVVRPAGPMAWLVETDDPLGLTAAVRDTAAGRRLSIVDVVPAARTVLVALAERDDLVAAGEWLRALRHRPVTRASAHAVDVPVRYDGADLTTVAAATGLDVGEVVARHSAAEYVSAFCGFAPGFAYLSGLDPTLVLPRRATPRTRVPAGSVAIAAEYTAVYPSVSPGGWHLLGRTDAPMWDLDRDPPALLGPGTRVRFVAVS